MSKPLKFELLRHPDAPVQSEIDFMVGRGMANPADHLGLGESMVVQEVRPGEITLTREELRKLWDDSQQLSLCCPPRACEWVEEVLFGKKE